MGSDRKTDSPGQHVTDQTPDTRKILILSYFTNEDGMACSHHIDDRLPVFRNMGYEPILLSSLCVPKHTKYIHFRVPSLAPSGIRFELRRYLKRRGEDSVMWKLRSLILLPLLPLYAVERLFHTKDSTWTWLPLALWRARRICRSGEVTLVYSTGGPPVVHAVARHLKERLSVRWLAEVQDPLIHGYCAKGEEELQQLLKVEKATYHHADRMIFLTRAAMDQTEMRVGAAGRGAVIYPGAAARRQEHKTPPSPGVRIAHFGSLGGVRNLETLIKGLEQAVAEEQGIASGLKIDLYGNVGSDDRERIRRSACRAIFSLPGLFPRDQGLEIMQRYDVLLLIQGVHDISRETIPSKLYEYLQSGRFVLGLVYRNRELEQMLLELGHAAVQADDIRGVANAFRDLAGKRLAGDRRGVQSSPFTIERAVRELLAL